MPSTNHQPHAYPPAVLIPAYNAESYLADLISGIRIELPQSPIILVDDGSQDLTFEVARQFGCQVVKHEENKGKGSSILSGLLQLNGSHWVICMDADLQHSPHDLPAFMKKIEEDQDDLVIGYRKRLGTSMPISRILSNSITSGMISLRLNKKILDAQCGFRAIRVTSLIKNGFLETGFLFESEYLIKAGLNGQRISWVPVKTIYNQSKSYIHPLSDSIRFIWLWMKSFRWKSAHAG